MSFARAVAGDNRAPALGGEWSIRMSRRRVFKSPPVSEVILDLQFEDEAPPEQLPRLPERIGGSLGDPVPVMRISNHALVSPRRIENQDPDHFLWGWEFLAEDPQRLVTVAAEAVGLHVHPDLGVRN